MSSLIPHYLCMFPATIFHKRIYIKYWPQNLYSSVREIYRNIWNWLEKEWSSIQNVQTWTIHSYPVCIMTMLDLWTFWNFKMIYICYTQFGKKSGCSWSCFMTQTWTVMSSNVCWKCPGVRLVWNILIRQFIYHRLCIIIPTIIP